MQTHLGLSSLFSQLLFDKKPDFLRADFGGKRYPRILEVLDNTIHHDGHLLKLRKVKKKYFTYLQHHEQLFQHPSLKHNVSICEALVDVRLLV